MNRFAVCFIFASVAMANAAEFVCPNDRSGQYKHPTQCDKYYECHDGEATELLCPDGLVFDENIRLKNKCDQPFNVDCEDRLELQPAKGTSEKCPRRNGFFAHPDGSICHVYYNCLDGNAIENKCANGLHFDELTGTCVWPNTIGREGCKPIQEPKTDSDDFTCPLVSVSNTNSNGQIIDHPKFAHATDCQRFYVCLNGVEKRSLGCPVGLVFNEVVGQCDLPERVEGCENWYEEVDEDDRRVQIEKKLQVVPEHKPREVRE